MKTTALRGNRHGYVDFSEGKLLVQIIPVKWIVQVFVFPAKNIDVRASCDDIRLTIREGALCICLDRRYSVRITQLRCYVRISHQILGKHDVGIEEDGRRD